MEASAARGAGLRASSPHPRRGTPVPCDASLSAVPHVLLVGAGAMGVITGYQLQLACAEVTFLVRPARVEKLSRPQTLYS
ncbi:2-dehydropantoate 2-reductase N-terminal domain-containing protein [Streptomyces sp. NBC_01275]|uniref:2-dehydropantoate 2-reductase N-terminal domain-containing protein n=1 Tax=Streptomyces sp. NBC_01275 TaxID=2903807 RepID=UPI00339040C9